MKKFEYFTNSFEINGQDIKAALNIHGLEGWELVSFFTSDSGLFYHAVFKRELE